MERRGQARQAWFGAAGSGATGLGWKGRIVVKVTHGGDTRLALLRTVASLRRGTERHLQAHCHWAAWPPRDDYAAVLEAARTATVRQIAAGVRYFGIRPYTE
jgi:hypothetical protein